MKKKFIVYSFGQLTNCPRVAGKYSYYTWMLLARNRDQQELWYFGVPGVYTPNEQFMASLFGFFHFKQAMRPSELAPDARFGYWYRTL